MPEFVNFQTCTSSNSGCSSTLDRSSQSCRYSISTCKLRAPFISEIHCPPVMAAYTVRFLALVAIAPYKCGVLNSDQAANYLSKIGCFFHCQLLIQQPMQRMHEPGAELEWGKKPMPFQVLFSVTIAILVSGTTLVFGGQKYLDLPGKLVL